MKNNKRMLSLFTALTMTVSAFSGLCMSASAEDTTITATLAHTAAAQGGSNEAAVSLDTETHYYNNWGSSGWIATAYSNFTFNAEELPDNPDRITGATLTTYINCARGTRTVDIGYVPTSTVDLNGATAEECTIPILAKSSATIIGVFEDVTTDYKAYVVDATDAIKAMIANGETEVVFAYANGAAGGNIYGSAAAEAYRPTLTVNVASADTVFHNVTVKTVCDGEELSSEDFTVQSGNPFTPAYEATFDKDGYRYTYESGADAIESITEDTVIEIVYTKRELVKTTATVNAVVNGVALKEISTTELTEGVGYTLNYPKYILDGSILYTTSQNASAYYGVSATGTDADQTFDIAYTEDVTTPAALFFAEGEDIGEDSNIANSAVRCSGGAAYKVPAAGVNVATLGAGTYTVEAVVWGSAGDTYKIMAGDVEVLSIDTTGAITTGTSASFTLDADTAITATGTDTRNSGLDYVLIRGTGSVVAGPAPTDDPGETTPPTTDDPAETEQPTETTAPTTEPTAEPTEEPVDAVEDGVFIDENYDSLDAGEVIRTADNTAAGAPDPVTKGSIIYAAGHRNNGSVNTYSSIADDGTNKTFTVSSDNYCTSGRGISFTFDAAANVPTMAQVEAGKVLEMSFDVLATNSFTVTGFGDITTADLTTTTEMVHARVILDKSAARQYLIVTNAAGEVLSTKVAALSATTFTGMSFYVGSGSFTLDNLKVEKKAADTGIVTLKALDNGAGLADTTITLGAVTLTTDANGSAVVALPNGTYTATASKSGYEHTSGLGDNDTQQFTVNSDVQDVTFSLSLLSYIALPEEVILGGGQVFIAAPKADAAATTDAFTVTVKDQYGIVMTPDQYVLEWEIHPAGTTDNDPNVTIDNGVVSVSNAFKVENLVAAYDVTVAAFTDDRNNKVSTTLYVANNDIIYYEPIAWSQPGGTGNRNATVNFAEAVTLPDMSAFSMDVNFTNGTEGQRTIALVADGGNLVGLQLAGTTVKAWTGWTGNKDMNQYGDVDTFTNGAVLVEGYANGTVLNVTFVIDKTSQNITVSCGSTSVSLPYTITANTLTGFKTGQYRNYGAFDIGAITVQEPDQDYLAILGDIDFAKVSGTTVTRAYELGQSVLVPDETFTWSVAPADQGVTVDENGVLSVADTAVAGTYALTATSALNAGKTATLPITVADFQGMVEINIVGPRAYELTNTAGAETAAVSEAKYGAVLVPTKSGDAVVVKATYADGRLVSMASEAVAVTEGTAIEVEAEAGTKVMLWNSLAAQEPMAEAAVAAEITAPTTEPTDAPTDAPTTAPTDEPTPTPDVDEPGTITGTYTIAGAKDAYGDDVTAILPAAVWTSSNTDVATIDAATGKLTVKAAGQTDITATITNGTAITEASITVYVKTYSITGDAAGDATTVDTSGLVADSAIAKYLVTTATADGVEVKSTEVEASAITAGSYTVDTTGAAKYEIAPIYTYAIGVPGQLGTYGDGFEIAVPADTYNFVVTNTGSRSDVYVNDQMLVNNILQGGSAVNSLAVNDIVIDEGIAKITTTDYSSGQNKYSVNISIQLVKSPSIVTRVPKLYTLGDSLVCIYYNGGNAQNNYQTGWGQVLDNYTKGVEIVDLANSGATANGLLGSAFTQILGSAQEGDILLLESGYNDRTYDTAEVMKNALRTMIAESEARGVKVILVSPNASAHTYGASVSWTGNMEEVAAETETEYIDLSQLSYDFFETTYAGNKDVMLATYNVSDRLHSTYHGANLCASIVAKGLADLGYTDIVDTEYVYTFTDSLGNTITCQAK